MKTKNIIPVISLQLFAEGGGAAGGNGGDGGTAQGPGVTAPAAGVQQGVTVPAAGVQKGVKANPLGAVQYGVQQKAAPDPGVQEQTTTTDVPDPKAEFEKLIKGQYKQQYDESVNGIVRQRLRGSQQTVDQYNALSPVLEMLGKKYGVDPKDAKALSKAIQDDDSFYEEEASRSGMSVEQLKKVRKIERENESLRQQMQARQSRDNADRQYAAWMQQEAAARQIYPGIDLKTELQNPQFVSLLKSNIDVKTAYEVIHKDEIIHGAMQYAVKKTQSNAAKAIASGSQRPAENGASSGSAAVVKSDVSQLDKNDIREIMRRVANGERISFG